MSTVCNMESKPFRLISPTVDGANGGTVSTVTNLVRRMFSEIFREPLFGPFPSVNSYGILAL